MTGVVPDDRLPAGGYTARFRVRDCAGNTGSSTTGQRGARTTLRLPLRDSLNVAAGVTAAGARGAARATVRSGTPVLIRGRVTTLDGAS